MEIAAFNPTMPNPTVSEAATASPQVFQYFLDHILSQSDAAVQNLALPSEPTAREVYQSAQTTSRGHGSQHLGSTHSANKTQFTGAAAASSAAPGSTGSAQVDQKNIDQLLQLQQQLMQLMQIPYIPMPMVLTQQLQGFVENFLKTQNMQGFVQSIEHFKSSDGKDGVRMVLWPETLGRVEVLMKADGKQINLVFFGSPEFKQYATDHISELAQAFSASGFAMGSHEFSQGGQRGNQDQNQGSGVRGQRSGEDADAGLTVLSDASLGLGATIKRYLQNPSQVLQTI